MRIPTVLLLLLAAVLPLAAQENEKPEEETNAPRKKTVYAVGDVVTDFTLPDLDGKKKALAEYAKGAKLVVMDFWSRRCPYCVGTEDRYHELHTKYSKKGVAFLHVNSNRTENRSKDELQKLRDTVKECKIAFPVLIDKDNVIADRFGAKVTPTVFIMDAKTLKILYSGAPNDDSLHADEATRDYIAETLESALAASKIKTPSTRAKG